MQGAPRGWNGRVLPRTCAHGAWPQVITLAGTGHDGSLVVPLLPVSLGSPQFATLDDTGRRLFLSDAGE